MIQSGDLARSWRMVRARVRGVGIMEILLGAIGDFIHKNMTKWRFVKYVLLALIFAIICGLAYLDWASLLGG